MGMNDVLNRLEPELPPLCSSQPSPQPSQPQISSTRGPLQQRGEASDSPRWNTALALTFGGSDLIFCVPLFVELWSKDPAKMEHFKTIHGLVCLMITVI